MSLNQVDGKHPAQQALREWCAICDQPSAPRRMALVATEGAMAIDCTGSGKDYVEDCANARFIAAAPELLAACESCIEAWESPQLEKTETALRLAKQAVAKARRAV